MSKPVKVLLIDAFSTLHVGNGALIDNTYKLCKKYIGDDIEIISTDPETNRGRFPVLHIDIFKGYGGGFLSKLCKAIAIAFFCLAESLNGVVFKGKLRLPWARSYRSYIDAIERSDVCVSLSGETINDHYRPHMYLRLLTYYLAIVRGKKFLVFPQSIGPIFNPVSKWLLRKLLSNAYAICARDASSFELAKNIWGDGKAKILFCPDVAVTQESSIVSLPFSSHEKKLVGLTVSDIPRAEMGFSEDYLPKLLKGIIDGLDSDDYRILLMPSNYDAKKLSSDYNFCLKAKKDLEGAGFEVAIMDNKPIHPDIYQGIQRSLFLFISTRMHVGILATSAGIPTLMINTQHKIRAYMSLMDAEDCVVELDCLSDVPSKLSFIVSANPQLRDRLLKNNILLREQVESTILTVGNSVRRDLTCTERE